MQFQEEVYTSAASLLEGRGGGNLGVVAKSRGFPREVEADMALLRGYTLLDGLAVDNSAEHPPRIMVTSHGGIQGWLCLSRVVFAGADHTGRTTPLAHHLAFELASLKTQRIGTAALLTAAESVFVSRWSEPPKWIEPARSLINVGYPEAAREFPSKAWQGLVAAHRRDMILAAAVQHLICFAQTKKALVICQSIAAASSVPSLMADLLALLPDEMQLDLVCASHVVDASDAPNDAALIFTYPGTRFLKQAQERRDARSPVIFDLSDSGMVPDGNGDYAAVISSVLRSGKAATELPRVREAWRQLGIAPGRVGEFRQALVLRNRLQKLAAIDELDGVARQLGGATSISPAAVACVGEWCSKYVPRAIDRWPPDERTQALVAIATDHRWPAALADAAKQRMRAAAAEVVPYVIERATGGAAEQKMLAPLLRELLACDRSIVIQLISKASTTGSATDARIALAAIERSGGADNSQLQAWLAAAITGGMARREIISAILARLTALAPNPAQNASLRNHYRGRGDHERLFLGEVYLPLLRDSLARARPRELWKAVAGQLVDAALDAGSESDDLAALAAANGSMIDSAVIDEWREQANAGSPGDARRAARLDRALESAGLGRPLPLQPAEARVDGDRDRRVSTARRPPRQTLRQPIGRAPRIASMVLACLTIVLLILPALFQGFGAIRANPGILIAPGRVALFFWATGGILLASFLAELFMLFVGLQVSTARMVRGASLALLIAAFLMSAYRLGNVTRPDFFRWFATVDQTARAMC